MSWSSLGRGGLFAALWLVSLPARAQLPPQVVVAWSTPGSCPAGPALEAEVARMIGPDAPTIAATQIDATLAEREGGFALKLGVTSGGERYDRAVTLPTCSEAREAAVLLIATTLHPGLALGEPLPDVQASGADEQRPRMGWAVRLGALVDARSLPGVSAGPMLGVGIRRQRVRAWLEGRYLFARRSHDATSRFQADVDLFAGALGAAIVWRARSVSLGPALEAELGALRGRGAGERAARTRAVRWASALFGAAAEYALPGRAALGGSLLVGFPLSRPAFQLEGEPHFYATASATARLTLFARLDLRSEK